MQVQGGCQRSIRYGLSMVSTALAALWLINGAQAQDRHSPQTVAQEQQSTFDIPPQPLIDALALFGRQSGMQVSVDAGLIRDIRSAGAKGAMSPEQALRQILSGTGVTYRLTDANTAILESRMAEKEDDGAIVLNPITVEGKGIPDRAEIGNLPSAYPGGQVARGGDLGMLGNRDIMDTPFNITSYTAQTIEDQQARTLADVVANDPSVRATHPSGGILDSFYIRGFPINEGNLGEVSFNGMFGVAPTFRLFTDYAERVEVIKGPTALLNGISPNSSVGGAINIVPKRASDVDVTRFTANYATELQGGGHLDFGRRLGTNRQFGIRFNGSYRRGDTPIDNQSIETPVGALALDYQGKQLRATVDVVAQREDITAPLRPLFPLTGIDIPDAPGGTSNLQLSWEKSRIDDISGLGRVEFDLTDSLTLFVAGGAGNTRVERLFGTPVILNGAGDVSILPQNFIFDVDRTTAEFGLRTQFDTGPVNHSLTFQGNRLHQRLSRGFNSGTLQFSNIFNPVNRPRQDVPEPDTVPKVSESEFIGFGIADTLSVLDERVQLTLGVRRQQIESKNFSAATGQVTSSSDEGVFTPLAGVIVKPLKNISLYANYVEGLSLGDTAPATAANAGEVLSPARSNQIEVGAKVEFDTVGLTLSAFQIEKPFGQLEDVGGALIFSEAGEQRNRGLELNVFGEITPGLRLLGGITFLDGELTKTNDAATRGNTPVGVPSVQLNLGTEWDTPFAPGLTLVGNVIYTGDQYVDTTNTQEIPSWTRLDLGARYRTTLGDMPIMVRATVQNVFDNDYFSGVASFRTLSQGAPRTALLSITADF